jgi:cell filamentation protein
MHNIEDMALQFVENSYFESEIVTADTRFTASIICQMHNDWLGKLYEWAGMYRTVDISKGGFPFPRAWLIPQNMENFERGVLSEHTPCRGDTLEDVSLSLAVVHSDLLLIHPFREGNGRLARWLADIMAAQAGLPLPDYGFTGKGSRKRRAEYLAAVIEGYGQNYEPLTRFFIDALKRRLAESL